MTLPSSLRSGPISEAPINKPVFLVYPNGKQTTLPVNLSSIQFDHGAVGWVEPLITETPCHDKENT